MLGCQLSEHLRQRLGLRDIAGENLTALGKATGVEHQGERHQRTIGALFLGMTERGVGVTRAGAFEIGVGQIVERDDFFELE